MIDVDLPRPRRLFDLVERDRANDIKKQALSILHVEAMRSFLRGSKAAADFVEAYSKRIAKLLNTTGYGFMGVSMLLFIVAGFRT